MTKYCAKLVTPKMKMAQQKKRRRLLAINFILLVLVAGCAGDFLHEKKSADFATIKQSVTAFIAKLGTCLHRTEKAKMTAEQGPIKKVNQKPVAVAHQNPVQPVRFDFYTSLSTTQMPDLQPEATPSPVIEKNAKAIDPDKVFALLEQEHKDQQKGSVFPVKK